MAVGGGAVAGEAGVCFDNFYEQGGAFFVLGYAGFGVEALAFGFDDYVGVGGGVEIPGRMAVSAIVGGYDDQVVGFVKLEVHQWGGARLAASASFGHEDEDALAFQTAKDASVGEAEQKSVEGDEEPCDDEAFVGGDGVLLRECRCVSIIAWTM